MRRIAAVALVSGVLAACSNGGKSDGGVGTSGSTSGSSGGTSGGTSGSSGGRGSSSGGITTGGSTGSSACAAGTACELGDGGAGVCCAGSCTNFSSDPVNCGGCGDSCLGAQVCLSGTCIATSCSNAFPGDECTAADGGAGLCCAGLCRTTFDDADDCGSCGAICPAGTVCRGRGFCGSDAGFVRGCGSGCPAGAVCNVAADSCVSASCADGGVLCSLSNGGLGECCNGACADELEDDANCGGCAVKCAAGQACVLGSCIPVAACGPGNPFGFCELPSGGGGTCCGTTCTDTFGGDSANCRACGATCPPATTCLQGSCRLPDGGKTCSLATCEPGSACFFNGACIPPCGADGDLCPLSPLLGGYCCGGACVDPGQDPTNCGACGVKCPSGSCEPTYSGSVCQPVGTGTDGGCGACAAADVCVGDLCVSRTCDGAEAYTGLCATEGGVGGCCAREGLLPDGGKGPTYYCANLGNDPENCGVCGRACGPDFACLGGNCVQPGDAGACLGREGDYCPLGDGGQGICCGGAGCVDPNSPATCGSCSNSCDGGTCFEATCL